MLNLKERIISGIVVIGVGGMMLWTAGSRLTQNLASYADSLSADEYFTTETVEMDLKGVFEPQSGMPCENREQFERWYETYEQETSEEDVEEADNACDGDEAEDEGGAEEFPGHEDETAVETDDEDETYHPSEEVLLDSLFQIDGRVLRPELQAYLRDRLSEQGIEWFMPYAIMIAYQESKFDIYAVNPQNGVDCGLFQFRSYYYPGTDIFNPYEQIDIFCEQMANRANAGCDVYEMISRHNVSDWGAYNATYVQQVMTHEPNLKEVKQ